MSKLISRDQWLLVKSITAFVTLLTTRTRTGCNWRDGGIITIENAGFELALV